MISLKTPNVIELPTDYGSMLLPDNPGAIAIAHEVVLRDCYGFQNLKREGFTPRMIWDLGASWGAASMLASALWPDCQIWAFEPVPDRIEFAIHNLRKSPNIHFFCRALVGFWNEDPQLVRDGIAHRAPLRPSPEGYLQAVSHSGIHAQSLTDFLQEFPLPAPIDLLKIDIEGGEIGVLTELQKLNETRGILHVRGEWHFNALESIPEILEDSHLVKMRQVGTNWDYFQATMRP